MKIYELVHMHGAETLADGRFHYGDCAMLGCFSSAERVAAAIEKYRSIPGFCDYPNGFVVFAHEVEEHAVLVFRQDNSTRWEVDGLIVEWSVDQYTLDEMNCTDGFEY